jgi:SAM-dependent methyltransferase
MATYDVFAKFYDDAMGDRSHSAQMVRSLIERSLSGAKTVLELACGTGSVLKQLEKHYEVAGLDSSAGMLAIAKKKVPKASLHRQDMMDFRLPEKFDVILCVFDSMNHLLHFHEWKKTFRTVRRHLATGGIFVFDINTQRKLSRLVAGPAWVHEFGGNLLVMDVQDAGGGISNWNIKIFERVHDGRYVLREEDIREVSFPLEQVTEAAKKVFARVRSTDAHGKRPSKRSERVFFVCTK